MSNNTKTLEERVMQFNTLSLPGQPMGMHMGTSYLVHDLMAEVTRLREQLAHAKAALSEERVLEVGFLMWNTEREWELPMAKRIAKYILADRRRAAFGEAAE